MRKRLRKKGMARGAQNPSDVFADRCVFSQCRKVRPCSCRLAESFSLAQLLSPKIHESGVLAGSQVSGGWIERRFHQKCSGSMSCCCRPAGAEADSLRATRRAAGQGNEVAAQTEILFFFFFGLFLGHHSVLSHFKQLEAGVYIFFFMIQLRIVHVVLHMRMAK